MRHTKEILRDLGKVHSREKRLSVQQQGKYGFEIVYDIFNAENNRDEYKVRILDRETESHTALCVHYGRYLRDLDSAKNYIATMKNKIKRFETLEEILSDEGLGKYVLVQGTTDPSTQKMYAEYARRWLFLNGTYYQKIDPEGYKELVYYLDNCLLTHQ